MGELGHWLSLTISSDHASSQTVLSVMNKLNNYFYFRQSLNKHAFFSLWGQVCMSDIHTYDMCKKDAVKMLACIKKMCYDVTSILKVG